VLSGKRIERSEVGAPGEFEFMAPDHVPAIRQERGLTNLPGASRDLQSERARAPRTQALTEPRAAKLTEITAFRFAGTEPKSGPDRTGLRELNAAGA
jgi:hypothetical protein